MKKKVDVSFRFEDMAEFVLYIVKRSHIHVLQFTTVYCLLTSLVIRCL